MASGMLLGAVGYLALGPIPPFDVNLASILMGLFITGFAGSIPWVSEQIDLIQFMKTLRGLGGVFDLAKVEIEFFIVSDREECQLPDAFYRIKKYCS